MRTGNLGIFFVLLFVTLEDALAARSCRCWEGYRPQRVDGEIKCYSKELFHSMSCNIPRPPKCICTGNNSVLKDRSGTWCTVYEDGSELKRWPCENTEDWAKFFKNTKFDDVQ